MGEADQVSSDDIRIIEAIVKDLEARGPIFLGIAAAVAHGFTLAFSGPKVLRDDLPLKN